MNYNLQNITYFDDKPDNPSEGSVYLDPYTHIIQIYSKSQDKWQELQIFDKLQYEKDKLIKETRRQRKEKLNKIYGE